MQTRFRVPYWTQNSIRKREQQQRLVTYLNWVTADGFGDQLRDLVFVQFLIQFAASRSAQLIHRNYVASIK